MASAEDKECEKQSDETFELLCSPCKRKERITEAQKYCTDCNDYYCSDCVTAHKDIPFLSGHKILDKGQKGTQRTLPVAPTERCERHRFKPVDMYCQSHDDVGCYTCMAVDHRVCKDIFDIPEYVQNNKSTPDAKNIREELQNAERILKEKIDFCKREKERLMKSKEEALQSLQAFREEINKKLDELEQNTMSAIDKKYQVLIETLNKEIRDLEDSEAEVKLADDSFISSENNASQRFVSLRKGKRAVESAAKRSDEISTGTKETNIYFKTDTNLLAYLEGMNLIGRITESIVLFSIRNKKQYNIKHQSDKNTCNISSACILEDGSTVLADMGNKKLKRIDRKTKNVDVCDLQEEPWQLCQVDNKTLAVMAEGGGETIVFISVENEMKKSGDITTCHKCYGIAAANGNIYVADDNTSVFVYSISGIKLNQFSKDQTGQYLFNEHYGMAVSDDGMKIYVSDNIYGLVVLNKDGTLQGRYSCSELESVRRVCVAENGSILVSGGSNSCILQFTSDGDKLGNVMASDTGTDICGAVCFDQQRDKLLVGRPNKDEIDIYDLY